MKLQGLIDRLTQAADGMRRRWGAEDVDVKLTASQEHSHHWLTVSDGAHTVDIEIGCWCIHSHSCDRCWRPGASFRGGLCEECDMAEAVREHDEMLRGMAALTLECIEAREAAEIKAAEEMQGE